VEKMVKAQRRCGGDIVDVACFKLVLVTTNTKDQ
jgi:hypothetical protein